MTVAEVTAPEYLSDALTRYNDAKASVDDARAVLDAAIVRAARTDRISYRKIAGMVGMSLGWVQAVLERAESSPTA